MSVIISQYNLQQASYDVNSQVNQYIALAQEKIFCEENSLVKTKDGWNIGLKVNEKDRTITVTTEPQKEDENYKKVVRTILFNEDGRVQKDTQTVYSLEQEKIDQINRQVARYIESAKQKEFSHKYSKVETKDGRKIVFTTDKEARTLKVITEQGAGKTYKKTIRTIQFTENGDISSDTVATKYNFEQMKYEVEGALKTYVDSMHKGVFIPDRTTFTSADGKGKVTIISNETSKSFTVITEIREGNMWTSSIRTIQCNKDGSTSETTGTSRKYEVDEDETECEVNTSLDFDEVSCEKRPGKTAGSGGDKTTETRFDLTDYIKRKVKRYTQYMQEKRPLPEKTIIDIPKNGGTLILLADNKKRTFTVIVETRDGDKLKSNSRTIQCNADGTTTETNGIAYKDLSAGKESTPKTSTGRVPFDTHDGTGVKFDLDKFVQEKLLYCDQNRKEGDLAEVSTFEIPNDGGSVTIHPDRQKDAFIVVTDAPGKSSVKTLQRSDSTTGVEFVSFGPSSSSTPPSKAAYATVKDRVENKESTAKKAESATGSKEDCVIM